MNDNQIEFSKEQTEAWLNLTKANGVNRVLYGGQAGGGKSFLICFWLEYMCQMYEGTRYYLARNTISDLKKSVLRTFFDVAKITNSNARYYDNKNTITYPNGSEIFLLEAEQKPSDPNFDSLGSTEYTAGAIEEGITIVRRAADVLLSRTRYKHDIYGLEKKQLITCNPGAGWIKDDIVIPWRNNELRPNWRFIPATLASNPNKNFSQSYTETLKDLPFYERARLLHGDWDAQPKTGGEFWKDFDQEVHVKPCPYNPDLPIWLSFDENVNPFLSCSVWQVDKDTACQIDEICLADPRNTRKEICKEIMERYSRHESGCFVTGDATSQKQDTAHEKHENFFTDLLYLLGKLNPQKKVPSKNPAVVASAAFINRIYEGQKMKQPYMDLKVFIDPSCSKSIEDYQYTLEDSDGTVKKERVKNPVTGVTYEKRGHLTDCKRYLITTSFKDKYKIYLRGGVNYSYIDDLKHL